MRVPAVILFARFRRFYPAELWRTSAYRTRDGVIPFGLFWIYYRAMQSLQALERVQLARGTGHAISMAFGNKDGELPDALRGDLRDAYILPE